MDKNLKPGRWGSVSCVWLEIDGGSVVVGLMVVVVWSCCGRGVGLGAGGGASSVWWWWWWWWLSSPMVVGTRGRISKN